MRIIHLTNWKFIAPILLFVFVMIIVQSPNVNAQEQTIVSRGEEFSMSATLLEYGTYGNPIPDQPIEFYDETYDTYLGAAKTNQQGIASLDIVFDYSHPLGTTILNATFRGNESLALAPIYKCQEIYVLSSATMNISHNNSNLAPGDTFDIFLELTDDHFEPIPFAKISVYSKGLCLSTQYTNASGNSIFHIECNSSWIDLGINQLEIIYAGNFEQYYRGVDRNIELNISKIDTHLSMNQKPNTTLLIDSYLSFIVTGIIEDDYMSEKNLSLYIDDIFHSNFKTDNLGNANITFRIDNEIELGVHSITVEYAGTDRFHNSSIELEIEVYSLSYFVVKKSEKPKILSEFIMAISITDGFGRPISGIHVDVYDTLSEILFEKTNQMNESIFHLTCFLDEKTGPRAFFINITGNAFLTNTTSLFIITIWSETKLTLVKSSIMSYASPSQKIDLEFKLENKLGYLPNKWLLVTDSENNILASNLTNQEGTVKITIIAPSNPGNMLTHVQYFGNETLYELTANLILQILVSDSLRAYTIIQGYTKVHGLNEIKVNMLVFAGNGSKLGGIIFQYDWLESSYKDSSKNDGSIELHLKLPSTSGIFELIYKVILGNGNIISTDSLLIIINNVDANAGEGLGIYPLALTSVSALAIPLYPLLKKRWLLG